LINKEKKMLVSDKQTFGVIVSTRSFFPSHLVKSAREAIVKKLDELGFGAVMVSEVETNLGAVLSFEEAKTCARLFRARRDEISGIIVVLPNFGEEMGIAEAIDRSDLAVPVLIQACDDDLDKLDMANRRDAFCGKLSVCNNLYQRGIPYSLTTLHTSAIDSPEFTGDLKKFAAVCRVVRGIRGARIASLGARPIAFNTVRYSEKILQRHKISVQTVDMSEIIARAERYNDARKIEDWVREIRAYGTIPPSIDGEKMEKQARLCLAMEETVDELECDASAVQCWDSLQHNYGCAACLGMSMMGEKGKPSACESDVTGALTMLASAKASGTAPAYMDWNNNCNDDRDSCICQHCSNFPKSFFASEMEIENLDVLGSTLGAERCFGACKGQVAPGPMTFAKISTDDRRGVMKLYVGEGEFGSERIRSKGGLAYCHVPGLQDLMRYIAANGFEHHVCFVRGLYADVLEEAFSRYLGAEVYRHRA
jgi:L-fucose isomerase-like protein